MKKSAINSYAINRLPVNGALITDLIPAGTAAKIRQTVAIKAFIPTIKIQQEVLFRQLVSGTVVEISQNVVSLIPSNTAIKISQFVTDKVSTSFLEKHKWKPLLTVDGNTIEDSMIFGAIKVTLEESQSNQCVFTLLVDDPVTYIDSIWGKTVTLDYISKDNGIQRVFTGVIAIPKIDLINRYVEFTCSNNRDELIEQQLATQKNFIGRYSDKVQAEADTVAEEVNERMRTVAASLDFDAYNKYHINSWYAKSVANYTYNDSDIFYREPKITWQDRTKVKNSIDINVKYKYTRLYHHSRHFYWQFPYDFCTFLKSQYSVPNVQMIEDAIEAASWRNTQPIVYTGVFPPGFCADGASLIFWNTSSLFVSATYSTVFDSEGNVVSDPDGNNVYGIRPFTKDTDKSNIFVIGAQWLASVRFSQYITEEYKLKVKSTQSINQFGVVVDAQTSDIDEDYDSSKWEAYTENTPMPAGAVGNSTNYYIDTDREQDDLYNTILTNIDLAKVSVLESHRNTQVTFQTTVKPFLTLGDTIRLNGQHIKCKGKVQSLEHNFDCYDGKDNYTTVTIALFRSIGAATTTATTTPTRPSDAVVYPVGDVVLGTHYGVEDPSFNGYIGNKNNPRVIGTLARTNVNEQFIVDTPKVDEQYTNNRTLNVAKDYEIAIPNDELDVELL